jgi:4-hydroxy-2-oxoheptanedioate aldolase
MNNLKSRIQSGEAVHGCWINMGSLVSAEIVGRAGFEWVLIDLEHGAGDAAIMYNQLQVLAGLDTTPIVRIDDITRPNVQHILDAGASGIMFPQVQNEEEAEAAIKMMYYPPHGIRGTARAYVANLDKILLGIIQIETVSALKHIDAIAAVDGVDVLFVGPFDLTTALGIFGQLDHMLYQQAIRDVADAARKYGKATGVLLRDPKEYEMYHDLGYRFLACGADGAFVTKGADEMVKQLNSYKSK